MSIAEEPTTTAGALVHYVPPPTLSEIEQLERYVQLAADTPAVPKAYRGKHHDILAAGLFGRERGVSLLTSLRWIDVIEGKPEFNAEGCLGLVRAKGHSVSGTIAPDGRAATVRGRRADTGDTMEFTFTLEMAQRAGLATKDTWKKYPQSMVWARAVDQLCRMLFSDVLMGLAGTIVVDDVPPQFDRDTGEIIGVHQPADADDSDVTDAELVDQPEPFSAEAFKERANRLPGEFRSQLRRALADAGCDRPLQNLTQAEQRKAMEVLDGVEQEAHATTERRRKHCLAVCAEIGLATDERHALIRYATEGATDSSRVLSERQLEQVIECVERVKADTLMLEHDADGNPMWWPNRPINPQPVNEYGEELY